MQVFLHALVGLFTCIFESFYSHAFDTDGGGTLDKTEFQNAFAKLGLHLTDTEVDVLFDENDPDRNGIDVHEFRKMVRGVWNV